MMKRRDAIAAENKNHNSRMKRLNKFYDFIETHGINKSNRDIRYNGKEIAVCAVPESDAKEKKKPTTITPNYVKSNVIERFWSKVKFGKNNECWEWQAGTKKVGYGFFCDEFGQGVQAHRYLYMELYGVLPKHILVCHSCDNKKCCNPNHLFEGTSGDNQIDRFNKNHGRVLRLNKILL